MQVTKMLILEADYSNDWGAQLWVMMEPEKPRWSWECWRLLVPTHALHTETGNINNGDGATASLTAGGEKSSELSCLISPPSLRNKCSPPHVWKINICCRKNWVHVFSRVQSNPSLHGEGDGKHFRALEPHQEEPGCLCCIWQHQLNPLPPQAW